MNPVKLVHGYRYFETQEKTEKVILIVRLHWSVLILPFIFGTIATVAVSGFAYLVLQNGFSSASIPFADLIFRAIFSLTILFGILYIFSSWLTRYLNVFILTNEHIVDIKQIAFFSRKISTLSLDSIEDVTIQKKGILPSLFDFGDVMIQTAGELPNFTLKMIADPEGVQRAIMEAKENYHTGHRPQPSVPSVPPTTKPLV